MPALRNAEKDMQPSKYSQLSQLLLKFSLDKARGLAYCRRGYTFVAHSQILQMAISKERLENPNKKLGRRGLVFALDYYLA